MLLLSNFLKTAGIFDEMDVLARAQFLEGFTGAAPHSKIRGTMGKSQLLGVIAHMMAGVQGTSPEWVSKSDTGLYRRAFTAVTNAIRNQGSAIDGADLMQTLMGTAGWTNEEGETIGGKPLFWSVGKYEANSDSQWLAKGKVPTDVAGLAVKFAFRRALDVIESEKTRAKNRGKFHQDIVDQTMSQSGEKEDDDWGAVIDALFSHPEHPLAKQFFDWLYGKFPQIMTRAKRIDRIKQYFDLLRSGQRGLTDTQAATAIGATLSQFSGAKIEFTTVLGEYLNAHPKERQKVLEMFTSSPKLLHGLLLGPGNAGMEARVASRYWANVQSSRAREARLDLAEQVATIYMSRQAGKASRHQ